jgi:DNA-binding response OmpR family regulator
MPQQDAKISSLIATASCAEPVPALDDGALPALVAALARAMDGPLISIEQALSTLQPSPRTGDPATQRHAIEHIEREAETVRAALASLGALCELRRGGCGLRTSTVELGDLLMAIIPTWKPRAPQHTFELALPGEVPTIVADEQRVEQALALLLEHAVKLAPCGGTIRVSVRPRHDEVVVTVRQQARAVVAAQLDQLFEPLARLDGCEDVVVAGGLGLPLARAIIEAHGGRVWAELPESLPGMLVCAAWPCVPPPHPALPQPASAPVEDGAAIHERLPLARARQTVLLAAGDPHLARYLRANLEAEQFRVVIAPEYAEVYRLLELEEPDLALLDTELAGMDRLDTLQRLRAHTRVPIVVLARRHDPIECARALDQGASDYLARPFSIEELMARVRAALRASATAIRPAQEEPLFQSGELTIDVSQRAVTVAGQPISLSKTEFKLLRALAHHAGRVLSHEALLERVWGPAYQHEVEFVWVYIRRLRRKIEPDPARPRYIQTVPGVGYRLVRG